MRRVYQHPKVRAIVTAALKDARATLAHEPALPGARRLATYRRASDALWSWEQRQHSSRRTGLGLADVYVTQRLESL